MTGFTITFHGVRGSMATPGPETARTGGNTSCVEITAGQTRIVLDAGTGLRTISDRLIREGGSETTFLLSHLHWDHIQGLPFFAPIYAPGHELRVISGPNGHMPLEDALRRQMSPPFFPVAWADVAHRVHAAEVRSGERFEVGPVRVHAARLNHPDPVYGYRLEVAGRALVYATDTEHFSCVDPALRQLAEGADILIYDAQYTPEEYSGATGMAKVGWGHSTYEAAAALARAAGVKSLVLYHHDPRRTDAEIDAIEAAARVLYPATIAAREGLVMSVGGAARARVPLPRAA